ncbi:MAG: type II secretion system protein GspL [Pseudomonadota bacterium]
MTAQYFIAQLDRADAKDWLLIGLNNGRVTERRLNLGDLVSTLGTAPATLLLSATEFVSVRSKLVGRSEAQLRQAAPYAIEDDLADDVEGLNVRILDNGHDDQRLLMAYDPSAVEALCTAITDRGITLNAAIPDAALLKSAKDELTVLLSPTTAYLSFANGHFVRIDTALLPSIVCRLVRDHELGKVSLLIPSDITNATSSAGEISDALSKQSLDVSLKEKSVQGTASSYLIRNGDEEVTREHSAWDVLPDSLRNLGKGALLQKWGYALAAGICIAALALHIGLSWQSIKEKTAELSALKVEQQAAFTAVFPDVKRIVNAEAQAKQLLAELQNSGPPPAEFLDVLYQSTELLNSSEDGLELTGFSFADGVLLLRTESSDMNRLEKYRGELSQLLSAEVVSAESSDNVVRGAIRIRR